MLMVERNRSIRAVVGERTTEGFPVRITFELGNEAHLMAANLEDLEQLAEEYGVRDAIVFRGESWQQLHD
jgi:hypothetical protein